MSDFLKNAQTFLTQNPEYGYLIAAIILLIFATGNFLNFRWATSPANTNQRIWFRFIGEKKFRYIMGTIFLLGAIACFVGFHIS